MSIHVMASKEDHTYIIEHFIGWDNEKHGPLYMKETHRGLVLSTGEYNGYDDSDFYALVWNPEKKCAERETYATTRGWTYPNGATVDATPEVIQAYKDWQKEQAESYAREQAEIEAKNPTKGKKVKVIGGRKHKGEEGIIFWRGANKFQTYYRAGYNRPEDRVNQRVGIITDNGEKFFTPLTQVEVIL